MGLKMFGNILDNVSTQILNISLVILDVDGFWGENPALIFTSVCKDPNKTLVNLNVA